MNISVQPDPNIVAARWRGQYRGRETEKQSRLDALENPTREQIEEIIGNRSWTRQTCDECGIEAELLMEFGCDYPTSVCLSCLGKAADILKDELSRIEKRPVAQLDRAPVSDTGTCAGSSPVGTTNMGER
jgi:hypothetical protein